MSATEFPQSGPGTGTDSVLETKPERHVVVENSRFLCLLVFAGSIVSGFLSLASLMMVFASLLEPADPNSPKWISVFWWSCGTMFLGFQCPNLWNLGRSLWGNKVAFDSRGVTFHFAGRTSDSFLPWDSITAIKRFRISRTMHYRVEAGHGSHVVFSYTSFFRPGRIARLIAQRNGLSLEKS